MHFYDKSLKVSPDSQKGKHPPALDGIEWLTARPLPLCLLYSFKQKDERGTETDLDVLE